MHVGLASQTRKICLGNASLICRQPAQELKDIRRKLMKQLIAVFALSAAVLLFGGGGMPRSASTSTSTSSAG
jgi:hypothetical protein